MSSNEPQFKQGHQPPISHQSFPGKQADMPNPDPKSFHLPTQDGGQEKYRAAGKLEGKKAVITGGDSGIGRSIAILYAMEGADVLIAYLPDEEEDAQQTRKMIEEQGQGKRKCILNPTDLTQAKNCKQTVERAVEELGGINILVNNMAYQQTVNSIDDLSEEQWLHTFNTNIHPFFFMSKYCLPHMQAGDSIINNGSINAYIGRPDLLDYTATKGAIASFTRGLANQLVGKRNIRVNCVAPGPVWTPLVPATMGDEQQENFNSPMGRPGQPAEIATCFVFLASTDSSGLTGQTLHANHGGLALA